MHEHFLVLKLNRAPWLLPKTAINIVNNSKKEANILSQKRKQMTKNVQGHYQVESHISYLIFLHFIVEEYNKSVAASNFLDHWPLSLYLYISRMEKGKRSLSFISYLGQTMMHLDIPRSS